VFKAVKAGTVALSVGLFAILGTRNKEKLVSGGSTALRVYESVNAMH